jgi:hypothetical protein
VDVGATLRALVAPRDEALNLQFSSALMANHSSQWIAYKQYADAGNCEWPGARLLKAAGLT